MSSSIVISSTQQQNSASNQNVSSQTGYHRPDNLLISSSNNSGSSSGSGGCSNTTAIINNAATATTIISPILTVTRTDSVLQSENDNEDEFNRSSCADAGGSDFIDETSSLINDGSNIVIVSHSGGGNVMGIGGLRTPSTPSQPNLSLLTVTQQSDVCRICHCGPNTLATPTPQVLTPVTSPKKLQNAQLQLKSTATAALLRTTTTQPSSPGTTPTQQQLSLQEQLQSAAAAATQQQQNLIIQQQDHQSPTKQQQQKKKILIQEDYNLISPCICSGSLKYVHQCCLQHWIRASNNTSCELCKHPYELRTKFKPLWKWESLPMGNREKKRIVCSALFHTVALACVIWSLYVLIARTIEELTRADLEWQFWTKIIVEAIGCLGAGILTYVWGKSYVSLFIKWISFNRSFVILGKEHRNSINRDSVHNFQSINKQLEQQQQQQAQQQSYVVVAMPAVVAATDASSLHPQMSSTSDGEGDRQKRKSGMEQSQETPTAAEATTTTMTSPELIQLIK